MDLQNFIGNIVKNVTSHTPLREIDTQSQTVTPEQGKTDINIVPDASQTENKDNTPQSQTVVPTDERKQGKPEYISDENYNTLIQNFPKELIDEYFNDPRAYLKKGGFYGELHRKHFPEPTPPDEKKIKNAKLLGSIGDAAMILTEMLNSNGAYIRNREYSQYPSANINKDERDLRNLYRQKMDKYNSGLFEASARDILQAYNEQKELGKGIQSILNNKRKLENDRDKFNTTMNYKNLNDLRNLDLKERQLDSLNKYRSDSLAIQRQNAATNKKRADAMIKRWEKGGNSGYNMLLDAHEKDNTAVTDEMNNRFKSINLSKEQVEKYSDAMCKVLANDDNMREKYPELITEDSNGNVRFTTRKDMLARAFMQEQYNSQFKPNYTIAKKGYATPVKTDKDIWDRNYSFDENDFFGFDDEEADSFDYANGFGYDDEMDLFN